QPRSCPAHFPYTTLFRSICGERCWQLRCEYLHQNKGFANTEDNTSIRFHLGVNCGTSVCQLDRISSDNSLTDIRIDIEQFCRRRSEEHTSELQSRFDLVC